MPDLQPARLTTRAIGVLLGTIALTGSVAGAETSRVPSDAEIRAMLAERIERLGGADNGIGIIVGVAEPRGHRVIAYGRTGRPDARPPDRHTVFEIASVTKAFTALLLSDMAGAGEVALTDPVGKYLPAAHIPERDGRSITLLDLATHTASLPIMPDDLPTAGTTVAYPAARLYDFLARYQLPHSIGTQWSYSNLDYWLLGEALTARAGTDFETLLRKRVLAPLNMHDTAITLTSPLKKRLAIGHNAVLQPAPLFSEVPAFSAMPAAGGMVSTIDDMLSFMDAVMGRTRSPLSPSIAAMLSTRRAMGRNEQALGWVIAKLDGGPLIVHDGGSFGYSSSVAWDPETRIGVVVLSNQTTDVGDIARHLLRPAEPLQKPAATKRTEIAIPAALLDARTGRYEEPDEGAFIVTKESDFLTLTLPTEWGLPKLRLRPESERDFFVNELPLRVTFETNSDGQVSGMLIYPPRGPGSIRATRSKSLQ